MKGKINFLLKLLKAAIKTLIEGFNAKSFKKIVY